MAFTLRMFEGFETGGFERCAYRSTFCNIASGAAPYGGKYVADLSHQQNAQFYINPWEFQGTPNTNANVVGFWFQITEGNSPTSAPMIVISDGAASTKWSLSFAFPDSPSNKALVLNDIDGIVGSSIGGVLNDLVINEWYRLEIWWENSAAADWSIYLNNELLLDQVSTGQMNTGATAAERVTLLSNTANRPQLLFDDIYFGEATAPEDRLAVWGCWANRGADYVHLFFDGSDTAPSGTNWSYPWNGIGWETGDSADISAPNVNAFTAGGTNAEVLSETISTVEARIYTQISLADLYSSVTFAIATDGGAESLLSQSVTPTTTAGWSSFYTLSAPTGGWTWADLQALELTLTPVYNTGSGTLRVYGSQLRVTLSGVSPTTGGDTPDTGDIVDIQTIQDDTVSATFTTTVGTGTERQAPDSIAVQTNLTGSVGDIDEDPDSPDANWLTGSGSTTLRVTFPTPSSDPTTGAGLQEFRAWVRRTNNGGSSENLYPEATFTTALSNQGGSSTLDCINEDQDGFATSYLYPTADDQGVSACPFPTPSVSPSGTQTVRVYCSKYRVGTGLDNGGSGVPTITVQVKDGGTNITTTGGTQDVTGEGWLSWTFSSGDLITADGSGVNITIATVSNGGGPNARSVAIDSIQWQSVVDATNPGYSLELYENGSQVGAVTPDTGTITSTSGEIINLTWDATNLGTADGSLVECYINQTSGTEYLEIGAVEWNVEYDLTDVKKTGWVQADDGPYFGPYLQSSPYWFRINNIEGVSTHIRTRYTGSGSTLGHLLLHGNSVDGTTEYSLGNASATVADYFILSTSGSIAPTKYEYVRVGFGRNTTVDVDIECYAALVQFLATYAAGEADLIVNPAYVYMPFLVR